jgi:hypothetical protein
VNLVPPLAWLRLPHRASLSSPHRGTGLALCVRPPFRASASAALTQALPQGLQRLGPERISSAARARPPQVARTLCPGPAPEHEAPNLAPNSAPLHTQRPGHATSAISAAPSERRRAGHAARVARAAPAARPGLIRAAQPAASEGSEGSREQGERPRVHERVAHGWGAATPSTQRDAHGCGAAEPSREHFAQNQGAAKLKRTTNTMEHRT